MAVQPSFLMKNPHLEYLAQRMREDHRLHPWSLSRGGLYIPHTYDHKKPDDLSHWDDVGFILNGRRYMGWWRHPRNVYDDAIENQAWEQHQADHGDLPDLKWMFDDTTTKHKHVGKSGRRKQPISGDPRQPSQEQKLYCALLFEREAALRHEGIDLQIHPSWTWRRYPRFMGMDLVAPVEVRNVLELGDLANLARQLVLGKTTLAERFPDAAYGRTDWLSELGRLHP